MAATAERHPLESALGHRFTQPDLLERALTHRSVTGTRKGGAGPVRAVDTNERLEFLGDRVLGLVVAESLSERFPEADEGELAQRLAALVAELTLVAVARELGLGAHVKASAGHAETAVDTILADACEAIVGAIHVDAGMDAARKFVKSRWQGRLEMTKAPPKDSKSSLQEWAQGQGLPLPEYREVERAGPDHALRFTVAVTVAGFAEERGEGKSKQFAETLAATAFLNRRRNV